MLVTLHRKCPDCSAETEMAVSDSSGGGSFTRCRVCGANIIAETLEDGHVRLTGQSNTTMIFLHDVQGPPDDEGKWVTVLPPEGLSLLNADYGQPPSYAGMADEEFDAGGVLRLSADLLFRPDGTRRSEQQIVRQIGWRGLWQAQLGYEISRRIAGPPPLSHPPKMFLSYRHQDAARNDWVAALATALKQRGYAVFFDRDLPPTDTPNVPEIVSRVADCRYFLALIDPGYIERIGSETDDRIKDGWVYDEYTTACRLSEAGLIRMVGLWREGEATARGFRMPEFGRQGNMVDVRRPEQLTAFLDQVFPARADVPGQTAIEAARAAIAESHAAYVDGDVATALSAAAKVAQILPGSPDGDLQIVRIALRTGQIEAGLDAADRALQALPHTIELLCIAAGFAEAAGRPRQAAAYAATILDLDGVSDVERAQAHAIIGSALDDLGRGDVAMAHLRAAVMLDGGNVNYKNTLGYILRRIGEPASAFQVLSSARESCPDDGMLAENCAAAACEAGDAAAASALVEELRRLGRVDRLDVLIDAIAEVRASGKPALLVDRLALPKLKELLRCDACKAQIILSEGQHQICAMCGAPSDDVAGPCAYCTFEGKLPIIPGLGMARCQFCRKGTIEIVER